MINNEERIYNEIERCIIKHNKTNIEEINTDRDYILAIPYKLHNQHNLFKEQSLTFKINNLSFSTWVYLPKE